MAETEEAGIDVWAGKRLKPDHLGGFQILGVECGGYLRSMNAKRFHTRLLAFWARFALFFT